MAIAQTSAYPSENQSFVVNLLAAIFGDQRIKGFKTKVNETQVSKTVRKRDWSLRRGIPNSHTVEPLLSGHLLY